jgi:uncharacterized membrane protein YphA (DoxX/SURF4 family)
MNRTKSIIYWISTLWLSAGMVATGVQQFLHMQVAGAVAPPGVEGMTKLGYPVYFLTVIGFWKILGVIALLVPKFPLVKEWAYAGFVILLTGALYSHIAVGHGAKDLFPAGLLLAMTGLSWFLRPESRTLIARKV